MITYGTAVFFVVVYLLGVAMVRRESRKHTSGIPTEEK
jgi:hypothetical protein